MKDFLGNEYGPGDVIVYAAMSGRSVTMVKATVVSINDGGTVTVRPVESSRWRHYSGRTRYIDKRTGKGIDPFAESHKHYAKPPHYRHEETGEEISVEDYSARRPKLPGAYRWGYNAQDLELLAKYHKWRRVSGTWHDYVEAVQAGPRPVTLQVTENIVKIPDGVG